MTEKRGQLIGRGREAEIYAWGEDQVLKLFYPSMPRVLVDLEARAATIACRSGVSTPAVGEIVAVDGRRGVVFQRIDGQLMLAYLPKHPWQLARLARQLAELQTAIHACEAPDLPSLKDEIRGYVENADTDADLKEAVLNCLQLLPDGSSLCHGDFHPDNVIMASRGPMVIDWSNGRRGDPLADVARSWLVLCMGEPPPGTPGIARRLMAVGRAAWYGLFLKQYRRLRPFTDEQLAAWKVPIVAPRALRDNIPEERQRMMDYLERALEGRRTG
jgi:uncharacterized protein (TIGR02172 family)